MFPTDEQYLKFVEGLDKRKLNLCTGNCGVFAFALKEVFKTGELFKVGTFSHVLLKYNDQFYDGEGIYRSIDDLYDSKWGQYVDDDDDDDPYELEFYEPEEAYGRIKEETWAQLDKSVFIQRIQKELIPMIAQRTLDQYI